MNELRITKRAGSDLHVAGYLAAFGSNGLNRHTRFDSGYTAAGRLPVSWAGVPEQDGLIGFVDWKTARADEKGLFVERVISRRQRYIKWLEELLEAGAIGSSAQPVTASVVKAAGIVRAWPIRSELLTVNSSVGGVASAVKALAWSLPSAAKQWQQRERMLLELDLLLLEA